MFDLFFLACDGNIVMLLSEMDLRLNDTFDTGDFFLLEIVQFLLSFARLVLLCGEGAVITRIKFRFGVYDIQNLCRCAIKEITVM
jgi:hypothetical protein